MRNLRIRSAATTATTALVAALALTACQPSDAVGSSPKPDATASSSSSSSATDEPASKESDEPQDSTDQSADNDSDNGKNDSGKNNSDKTGADDSDKSDARTTCTGSNTKITVTEVARPVNHLLVTATNAGGGTCDAYYAPLLGFDDAQAVTQINEDSKPQAVVTLSPGESAYASIALGGADGAPSTAAYKLSVHFSGRANEGSVGSPANLTLPEGTMTTDSTSVSYWQSTMADALVW